jgi:hypothetical protein
MIIPLNLIIDNVDTQLYHLNKNKFNKFKKLTFCESKTEKMLKKCFYKKKRLPKLIEKFNEKKFLMKEKKRKSKLRSADRDFKYFDFSNNEEELYVIKKPDIIIIYEVDEQIIIYDDEYNDVDEQIIIYDDEYNEYDDEYNDEYNDEYSDIYSDEKTDNESQSNYDIDEDYFINNLN